MVSFLTQKKEQIDYQINDWQNRRMVYPDILFEHLLQDWLRQVSSLGESERLFGDCEDPWDTRHQ